MDEEELTPRQQVELYIMEEDTSWTPEKLAKLPEKELYRLAGEYSACYD